MQVPVLRYFLGERPEVSEHIPERTRGDGEGALLFRTLLTLNLKSS